MLDSIFILFFLLLSSRSLFSVLGFLYFSFGLIDMEFFETLSLFHVSPRPLPGVILGDLMCAVTERKHV